MKKYAIIALFSCLLISCASITSDNYQKIDVYADHQDAKLLYDGVQRQLPTSLWVSKAQNPLELTYIQQQDTLHQSIPRGVSGKFVVGNFFILPPFGHIIDLTNTNRFKYPQTIVLPSETSSSNENFRKTQRKLRKKHHDFIQRNPVFLTKENERKYRKHLAPQKGDVFHIVYLPSLQFINFQSQERAVKTVGWFAMGYGYERYYTSSKSWRASLQYKFTGIFPMDMPQSLSEDEYLFFYTQNRIRQFQFVVENNYKLNQKYAFAIGVSMSYNQLHYVYYDNEVYRNGSLMSRRYNAVKDQFLSAGLSAKISRNIGNRYYLSLIHQPNIVNFTAYGTQFHYQPNFTFELSYKF